MKAQAPNAKNKMAQKGRRSDKLLRLALPLLPAALNRIRGPFNVSLPALKAGVAAIEDQAFGDMARAHNAKWLGWLKAEIEKLGLAVTPSVGNFLLVHFSSVETAKAADAFAADLVAGEAVLLDQGDEVLHDLL